ncbi:RTC4-like domain-containing protein [Parasitella parasitica]|nr:RTC4-like domain-containing protein [Parasitella parasitica]
MPFIVKTAGISANDKRLVCRTHQIELVFKPLGRKKGYPEHIDFDAIADRITLFQDEILGIIERRVPSTYLDAAYSRFEKLGVKARSTKELLVVFEDFKPGYYGVKGSDAIMQTLFGQYLETSIIDFNNVKPLTPVEFIQQILVPETGLRLIRQDRDNKIDLQEAKQIMKESEEYGSMVYYKAKKDRKNADSKKGEDEPFEGITFDDPLSMRKADNEEDDDMAEDLLNSQLTTASQGE